MAVVESTRNGGPRRARRARSRQLHGRFARGARRAGARSSSSAARQGSARRRSCAVSATSCRRDGDRPLGRVRPARDAPTARAVPRDRRARDGALAAGVLDAWSAPHDVAAALLGAATPAGARSWSVEDAHWADEGTLDVLRMLGRRIAATPCLVARHVPRRPARRAPPAPHRARGVSHRGGRRAPRGPAPFPRRRRRARRGRATSTSTRVWRLTSGNPFYVTELLAARRRTRCPARSATSSSRGSRSSARRRPPSSRRRRSRRRRSMRSSCSPCAARRRTRSTSASRAACSTRATAASPSDTSFPARPWRSRSRPHRRLALHRSVLLALTDIARRGRPTSRASRITQRRRPTRDAVLRYAPAAAEQAARPGAYREAAAQYARALRFAGDLAPGRTRDAARGPCPRAATSRTTRREAIEELSGPSSDRRGAGAVDARPRARTELDRLPLVPWLPRRGRRDAGARSIARAREPAGEPAPRPRNRRDGASCRVPRRRRRRSRVGANDPSSSRGGSATSRSASRPRSRSRRQRCSAAAIPHYSSWRSTRPGSTGGHRSSRMRCTTWRSPARRAVRMTASSAVDRGGDRVLRGTRARPLAAGPAVDPRPARARARGLGRRHLHRGGHRRPDRASRPNHD